MWKLLNGGDHGGEYEDYLLSSVMLRRIVWYKFTDFSEVHAASIIRAIIHRPDDGGSMLLLPEYTVQHPRTQSSPAYYCFRMVLVLCQTKM
jgi:hypothetical protein